MMYRLLLLSLFISLVFFSCSKEEYSPAPGSDRSGDPASNFSAGGGSGGGGGTSTGSGGQPAGTPLPDQSGLITAGEWNDLVHWDYWQELTRHAEYGKLIRDWKLPADGRVSVLVTDNTNTPLRDIEVELRGDGKPLYLARTDQTGHAELFGDISSQQDLRVYADGQLTGRRVPRFGGEAVRLIVPPRRNPASRVEVAFLVDATGSMGDELEFLKDDLGAIISTVGARNGELDIRTATVFYRDEGDAYVTRHSDFTEELSSTTAFIREQQADGGGDWPEAVHEALRAGLHSLRWSENARSRIAFLLLDAPPHPEERVLDEYRSLVMEAAARGIRIVPVVASGIDRNTEFLMRLTAIATNGTYVFITNDSGIGNEHLEPTVGDYEVEYLKDLIVRVIGEYAG